MPPPNRILHFVLMRQADGCVVLILHLSMPVTTVPMRQRTGHEDGMKHEMLLHDVEALAAAVVEREGHHHKAVSTDGDVEEVVEACLTSALGNVIKRRFLKGELLGKGGFAKVYTATCVATRQVYALKVVCKQGLARSKAREKQLQNEIRIHRALNHRHIVKFEQFFEDDKNAYILLELCENQSLAELLKRKRRFSEEQVQMFLLQLIDAIRHLHARGIIHRDLKLGNLFLDRDMKIKVGDLGLAARVMGRGDRKRTMCGTPNYIAPEVLQSTNGHSFQVDIWSLGVITYTLLVGRPPYECNDVKSTYRRILANQYSFPLDIRVGAQAKSLVRSMLQLKPEARPSLTQLLEHPFLAKAHATRADPDATSDPPPRVFLTVPANTKPRPPTHTDTHTHAHTDAHTHTKENVHTATHTHTHVFKASAVRVPVCADTRSVATTSARSTHARAHTHAPTEADTRSDVHTRTHTRVRAKSKEECGGGQGHVCAHTDVTRRGGGGGEGDHIDMDVRKTRSQQQEDVAPTGSVVKASLRSAAPRRALAPRDINSIAVVNTRAHTPGKLRKLAPGTGTTRPLPHEPTIAMATEANAAHTPEKPRRVASAIARPWSHAPTTALQSETKPSGSPPSSLTTTASPETPTVHTHHTRTQHTHTHTHTLTPPSSSSSPSPPAPVVVSSRRDTDRNKAEGKRGTHTCAQKHTHIHTRASARLTPEGRGTHRGTPTHTHTHTHTSVSSRAHTRVSPPSSLDRTKPKGRVSSPSPSCASRRSAVKTPTPRVHRPISAAPDTLETMHARLSRRVEELAHDRVHTHTHTAAHTRTHPHTRTRTSAGTEQLQEGVANRGRSGQDGPTRTLTRAQPLSSRYAPKIWVCRYVDYTCKYGLGFLCNNMSSGVFFNDSTSIVVDTSGIHARYIPWSSRDSERERCFRLSDHPLSLEKKVTLVNHFRSHLVDQERECSSGTHAHKAHSDTHAHRGDPYAQLVFVKKWAKSKYAVVFRLSSRVVQVIFTDQTEVLLSEGGQVITEVDARGQRCSYAFASLADDPSKADLLKRVIYATEMLKQMLSGRTSTGRDATGRTTSTSRG